MENKSNEAKGEKKGFIAKCKDAKNAFTVKHPRLTKGVKITANVVGAISTAVVVCGSALIYADSKASKNAITSTTLDDGTTITSF